MIHPLIQPIFRIQIRPTTGRLLQMQAPRPLRDMWVSAMAMSPATVSQITAMSDAFAVGPREIVSNLGYYKVHVLHICIIQRERRQTICWIYEKFETKI